MADPVSIVNRALTKIGSERILTLNDEVKSARVMKALYEDTLAQELASYRWGFAIKRAQLAALEEKPAFGYAFAYALPLDYLNMIQINGAELRMQYQGKALWSVECNQVLTDMEAPLMIRYVSLTKDARFYSPLFVEVFACKLAVEACDSITQSNTKKNALLQEYQFAVSRAVQQSAIEKAPDVMPDGNWLKARSAGWGGFDA